MSNSNSNPKTKIYLSLLDMQTDEITKMDNTMFMEFLDDIGDDVDKLASDSKQSLQLALQLRNKKRFSAIREDLKNQKTTHGNIKEAISSMSAELKEKLVKKLLNQSDLPPGLSLAFRESNEETLKDEDLFEDLAELGYFDELINKLSDSEDEY